MGAITIGPLVLATDRFAAILGILVFTAASSVLASRKDARFGAWATSVVLIGLVSARLGHVIEHFGSFAEEPLRIFAVWQGGFSLLWAILPVALFTVVRIREQTLRLWTLLPFALGLLAWNTAVQLAGVTAGKPPPEITLEQLNGPPVDLAAPVGKPRVINIWATWCPPCRREMPMLADAARTTPEVEFLFVNHGEGRSTIIDYLAGEALALSNVLLDSGGAVSRHYGTVGIPVTLFIDEHGTMNNMHVGEISRELLGRHIERLRTDDRRQGS